MLKNAKTTWTIKNLIKEISENNVTFENTVQRTLVWTDEQKSLLIDSILRGYPIPPMYASKDTSNGIYDMLDGKQRSNALYSFINNEFELTDNIEAVENKNNEEIVIKGHNFTDLPQEFKDIILDSTIDIIIYDDLTDEEFAEVFRRLNNGKPLSSIELTRVKAKSLDTVIDIGKHEIFVKSLTEKALKKRNQEDIIIKTYATLFVEKPSFETKVIRPLMEEVEITKDQKDIIMKGYNKLLYVYNTLKKQETETDNKDLAKKKKTISKKILTKTHLISLMLIATKEGNTFEDLLGFVEYFFTGKNKPATISEIYNLNSAARSASSSSVQKRNTEILNAYENFIKSKKSKEE